MFSTWRPLTKAGAFEADFHHANADDIIRADKRWASVDNVRRRASILLGRAATTTATTTTTTTTGATELDGSLSRSSTGGNRHHSVMIKRNTTSVATTTTTMTTVAAAMPATASPKGEYEEQRPRTAHGNDNSNDGEQDQGAQWALRCSLSALDDKHAAELRRRIFEDCIAEEHNLPGAAAAAAAAAVATAASVSASADGKPVVIESTTFMLKQESRHQSIQPNWKPQQHQQKSKPRATLKSRPRSQSLPQSLPPPQSKLDDNIPTVPTIPGTTTGVVPKLSTKGKGEVSKVSSVAGARNDRENEVMEAAAVTKESSGKLQKVQKQTKAQSFLSEMKRRKKKQEWVAYTPKVDDRPRGEIEAEHAALKRKQLRDNSQVKQQQKQQQDKQAKSSVFQTPGLAQPCVLGIQQPLQKTPGHYGPAAATRRA